MTYREICIEFMGVKYLGGFRMQAVMLTVYRDIQQVYKSANL